MLYALATRTCQASSRVRSALTGLVCLGCLELDLIDLLEFRRQPPACKVLEYFWPDCPRMLMRETNDTGGMFNSESYTGRGQLPASQRHVLVIQNVALGI